MKKSWITVLYDGMIKLQTAAMCAVQGHVQSHLEVVGKIKPPHVPFMFINRKLWLHKVFIWMPLGVNNGT